MGFIEGFFNAIGDFTWGWALIPFLVVLGITFTLISRLVQIRYFGRMWAVLKGNQPGAEVGAITPLYWQAHTDSSISELVFSPPA